MSSKNVTKSMLNTMKTLIDQKHCLMCQYYIKSNIPKDKGSCLKLDKYPAYKHSEISCKGKHFILGGHNLVIYSSLLTNINLVNVKKD